jgi:hypothetical protein
VRQPGKRDEFLLCLYEKSSSRLPGQFCYIDVVLTVVKNSLRRYLWTFILATGLAHLWVFIWGNFHPGKRDLASFKRLPCKQALSHNEPTKTVQKWLGHLTRTRLDSVNWQTPKWNKIHSQIGLGYIRSGVRVRSRVRIRVLIKSLNYKDH